MGNLSKKTTHTRRIERVVGSVPGANWAAITGITFVVLDCDSEEAVKFVESGQVTRSPLKQKTPRGGYHYFYQINEGLNVRNMTGKLDVRGRRWLRYGLTFY